ncbi:MAG: FAD-dependent oxidoreductase [Kiritimatiellae bacterium]|nr:FAD-dependent oxidoreductase [Kiritimatiellia bacterium]MDD5521760.1 FAD-dependent oxidoreductase [Kiritimatiellia bacterium]
MKKTSRRSFLLSSAVGVSGFAGIAAAMSSKRAETAKGVGKGTDSRQTYSFQRELPVEEGFDLVVAGGGPAGTAAAVCAARLGSKVLLLEATGCLGGMGTSGLVTAFDPMANGEKMLVGGLMREIVTTMHQRGFLAPQVTADFYSKWFHTWTPFKVEGYKLILDELVTAAKVDVRFFTRVVGADVDKQTRTVRGVIIHNIEGMRYVRAKTFVDGTGDAVLTDLCGAPCREAGRDTPNIMPPTLCSICGGIDWKQAKTAKQQALVEKALADGYFSQKDRHVPGLFQTGETVGMLNAGHVFHMNALRCRSLSDGVMHGRKLAREYVEFYRKYVLGCENIEHVTTANLMGVRESRRIVGEYELNFDDYIARRQFHDQIGVYNAAVDIHVYDDSDAEYERYHKEFTKSGRLKFGECFGLPYSILVPRGWQNLWVAGRCNSSDVRVHGAIRVQPPASMMGQAAGTASVQSIATGQPACDLDTAKLVETLRQNGAYLPQPELKKTMTRTS